MDLFEELESQLAATSYPADHVMAFVAGQDLRLTNIQLGSDFLAGAIADCWVLVKLNAISRIRGKLPAAHEVSFENALNYISWPRRVRLNLVGERDIALGVHAGFLKMHSRAGGYLLPLAAVSLLLIEPVENSKPKN